MTLSVAQKGRRVRLVAIKACAEMQSRLAEMGLIPGIEMSIIQTSSSGDVVIGVKGSKLMLGNDLAKRIVVL